MMSGTFKVSTERAKSTTFDSLEEAVEAADRNAWAGTPAIVEAFGADGSQIGHPLTFLPRGPASADR